MTFSNSSVLFCFAEGNSTRWTNTAADKRKSCLQTASVVSSKSREDFSQNIRRNLQDRSHADEISEVVTQRALLLYVEILQHFFSCAVAFETTSTTSSSLSLSLSEVASKQQRLGARSKHRQLCRIFMRTHMDGFLAKEATVDILVINKQYGDMLCFSSAVMLCYVYKGNIGYCRVKILSVCPEQLQGLENVTRASIINYPP